MSFLLRLTERLERFEAIDRVGRRFNDAAHGAVRTGRFKDLLSGTWLGHLTLRSDPDRLVVAAQGAIRPGERAPARGHLISSVNRPVVHVCA